MTEQLASWCLSSPTYFNVSGTCQLSINVDEASLLLNTVLLGSIRSFSKLLSQKPMYEQKKKLVNAAHVYSEVRLKYLIQKVNSFKKLTVSKELSKKMYSLIKHNRCGKSSRIKIHKLHTNDTKWKWRCTCELHMHETRSITPERFRDPSKGTQPSPRSCTSTKNIYVKKKMKR